MEKHINITSTKIFKSTTIFYIVRLMIPREQLNQLLLSFVDSYLNFANFALESTWKANCRLELSNCQGKCSMKLPSFKNQFTHSKLFFYKMGRQIFMNFISFYVSGLDAKTKLVTRFRQFIYHKTKNEYQLRRRCTLFEPFCKSKFSQLCINYRDLHL